MFCFVLFYLLFRLFFALVKSAFVVLRLGVIVAVIVCLVVAKVEFCSLRVLCLGGSGQFRAKESSEGQVSLQMCMACDCNTETGLWCRRL